MVLDNKIDFLSVARKDDLVVAAPFPISWQDGFAKITATKGVKYQILINGKKFVDVESQGTDLVPLAALDKSHQLKH